MTSSDSPNRAGLGLMSATALVVASMIGTGVFTTSGFLLAELQSPGRVMAVWFGGGVLATLGALCYAALAARLPESGGEYLFLSRTCHPSVGYVAGWISLLVGFSAPLAYAAFAFGDYSRLWWANCSPKLSGTLLILIFAGVHMGPVRQGALIQNAVVLSKVLLITLFIGLAMTHFKTLAPQPSTSISAFAFAVALTWVSLSYSGWNAAVYIASEVREAERILPRALLLGTGLVTALYLALNAVLVYSAPIRELAGQADIGRRAAQALGGRGWANAVTSLVAWVLVSSVSAQLMAGPRVYAKMASDGYLPRWLASGRTPPRRAIGLQALMALTFLWTASFEWLLTYIGFTLGVSTAAAVVGLIRLRLREGDRFPVVGWPWVPALFLVGVIGTTLLSLVSRPQAAVPGLATLLLGWIGWWCHAQALSAQATARSNPFGAS